MVPDEQNILVVEADAGRRRLIERILVEEGFPVTAVSEGLSAIRAVKAARYALVIAATVLPGSLDGAATIREARRRQPGLKALLTAASAETCLGSPAGDEVIILPFRRGEFLGCVFALLQRGQRPGSELGLRWREARHAH